MRALPQSSIDEAGAVRGVPVVHRRVARRLDVRADFAPRDRAQRHRRVRRPEGGRADAGDRPLESLGEERKPDDVGSLALVGAHAERRVALEMLDRLVALARRERDVGDGDVVLQVDEALGAAGRCGDGPQRRERPVCDAGGTWRSSHVARRNVRALRCSAAGGMTIGKHGIEVEVTRRRACGRDRVR